MSRAVKTIVLWLIALAIPLQGMAAAVFPLCPSEHHSAGLPAVVAAPAAHHFSAERQTAMGDHHPHHQSQHEAAMVAADIAASQDTELLGHGMLNCCSAAGAMLALGVPLLAAPAPLRSPEPLPPAAQADLGVTLDGLERPPRNILV